MHAVTITGHGGTEYVEYGEYPVPEVGPTDVRFAVKAGALNHLDVWVRRGLPGLDLELPHVPGSDAAGVVEAVGEEVTRFAVGDRVAVSAGVACGTCEFCRDGDAPLCVDFHIIGEHVRGVHAEEAVVPEDNLIPVPDGVEWAVAGSATLVFQTAWRMLIERAEVRPGESVLVLGASGGVGHAALQIAAHAGAEVFATASSAKKLDYAREHGADHVFDYETGGVADWVREETDGRGVDVVVDHVGGETWDESVRALAKGGRLVTCGATAGRRPETDVPRVFWNSLSILGSTMATPGQVDDVMALVWDGTFEPAIREVLPMSESARAHRLLEEREGFGKVVLRPDREL
ncbi:zinc-binding dehydrogenase [Natronobiforma cellulositropha]|uniref:zinc-binding dehydrogenase n=1 Tax=Natronobiforma cellulositropha TaxID=1679076 RepID=UPI0021D59C86|nr:zinc-binding dehydrogenase [Natronobiforma cellulositropha]